MLPINENLPLLAAWVDMAHHEAMLRDVKPTPVAHPAKIAATARELSIRFRGQLDEYQRAWIDVAEQAGLLVYAISLYGLNYEGVCQKSGHPVAEVVSRCTPSGVYKHNRRVDDLSSRLSEQDREPEFVVTAQLVKMAEYAEIVEACRLRYPDEAAVVALSAGERGQIWEWAQGAAKITANLQALRPFATWLKALRHRIEAVEAVFAPPRSGRAHRRTAAFDVLAQGHGGRQPARLPRATLPLPVPDPDALPMRVTPMDPELAALAAAEAMLIPA